MCKYLYLLDNDEQKKFLTKRLRPFLENDHILATSHNFKGQTFSGLGLELGLV